MKVTTDGCLFGAWCAKEIEQQQSKHMLDIGAGTGLLSLMVAQKNKNAYIDAVEIDTAAAMQAGENIVSSPWKEHIHIYPSDITTFSTQRKYDSIVSNPPFYENEIVSVDDKKNTAHHSTDLTTNSLLAAVKNHIANDGHFYLLWPYKRKNILNRLLPQYGLFVNRIILVRQSVTHDYFRMMLAGSLQKSSEIITTELSIWNEEKQYTPEFLQLLRDYYLYL